MHGNTPLIHIATWHDITGAKLLIERGADVNAKNAFHRDALSELLFIGRETPNSLDFILELIHHGAEVYKIYNAHTFTKSVCYMGRAIEMMTTQNPSEEIIQKRREIVRAFVERGAFTFRSVDPLGSNLIVMHNPWTRVSPISMCIELGHYDLLMIILGNVECLPRSYKYMIIISGLHRLSSRYLRFSESITKCIRALLGVKDAPPDRFLFGKEHENECYISRESSEWWWFIPIVSTFYQIIRSRSISNMLSVEDFRLHLYAIVHIMAVSFPGYARYARSNQESILTFLKRRAGISTESKFMIEYTDSNPLPTLFDILYLHIECLALSKDT